MKRVDWSGRPTRWLTVNGEVIIAGALVVGVLGAGWLHNGANNLGQTWTKLAPERTPMARSSSYATVTKFITPPKTSESSADIFRATTVPRVSPSRRVVGMSPEVMGPYEKILSALKIPPNREQTLKELIVEWTESGNDVDDLGKENRLGAETISVARKVAEVSLEQDMENLVGAAKFGIVREMIGLTPQLADIAQFADRNFSLHGIPLSAEQMLSLAEIYRDAYVGSPTGPPVDRSAGFDPATRLGDPDRRVLASAATILSPLQIEILHRVLAGSSHPTQP